MQRSGVISIGLVFVGLGILSISNLVLAAPSSDGSTTCFLIQDGWRYRCTKSGQPADKLQIKNKSNVTVLFDIDAWGKSSCNGSGGQFLNKTGFRVPPKESGTYDFQAAAQGTCIELTIMDCRTDDAKDKAIKCPDYLNIEK